MKKSILISLFLVFILAIIFVLYPRQMSRTGGYSSGINLSGMPVRITNNDDPLFAKTDFDDSSWTTTTLPSNWRKSVFPDYSGTVWYRIHATLPSQGPTKPIGISLGAITQTDETYFNGVHIGSTTYTNGLFNNENSPRTYEIPSNIILNGKDNVIAIRVFSNDPHYAGPVSGNFSISYYNTIIMKRFRNEIITIIDIFIYFAVFIFLISSYIHSREKIEMLFLSLFCLSTVLYLLTHSSIFPQYSSIFSTNSALCYIAVFSSLPLLHATLVKHFNSETPYAAKISYWISALCSVIALFSSPYFSEEVLHLYVIKIPWLILSFHLMYLLIKKGKTRKESYVILLSCITLFASLIIDFMYDYIFKSSQLPIWRYDTFPTALLLFILINSFLFIFKVYRINNDFIIQSKRLALALESRDAAYKNMDNAYLEAVERIAITAELREPETENHIRRVRHYSLLMGEKISLDKSYARNLYYASLMHDVGVIGIPDSILFKRNGLTHDERETMKKHTLVGSKIFEGARSPVLIMAREITLTHHERYDGTGYPNGLKGQDIPLSGRIVALADTYDALRSKRHHKTAFSHENAIRILAQGDGKTMPQHFDPVLLDLFIKNNQEFAAIYDRFIDEDKD